MQANYADDVKASHGHLVGSPSSTLARDFRGPDEAHREAPITYTTKTGEITQRLEPYVVWHYYRWNWFEAMPLKVSIDDRTGDITRFKGPLN